MFLSPPNLLHLNICEKNHEDVNEEHNLSIRENMNEERDQITHLFV